MAHPDRHHAAPPAHFEDLFMNVNFVIDPDEEEEDQAVAANRRLRGDPVAHNEPSCWVFGYGSLCWFPGFEYSKCVTGYIRGYVRRFWQGNTTHRGTEEKPGRVVTLIEDKKGITWGFAYRIAGEMALGICICI